jgi:hypothetical protein
LGELRMVLKDVFEKHRAIFEEGTGEKDRQRDADGRVHGVDENQVAIVSHWITSLFKVLI